MIVTVYLIAFNANELYDLYLFMNRHKNIIITAPLSMCLNFDQLNLQISGSGA